MMYQSTGEKKKTASTLQLSIWVEFLKELFEICVKETKKDPVVSQA